MLVGGIAAAVISVIFFKKMLKLKKSTWMKGFFLSLLEPSGASFLAAHTIIMVPMFLLLFHKKPAANLVVRAAVILTGLWISTGFKLSLFSGPGTVYMLVVCAFSAVYTIAADKYTKEEDPLLICAVQMIFTALIGFILWYMEEPATFKSIVYTKELLSSLFILSFFAKAYAYIALMLSQKYTDAVSVTVIASTEPVVTLFLAVLLPAAYGGKQSVTAASAAGALVIAAGAVVAGLNFLKKERKCGHGVT